MAHAHIPPHTAPAYTHDNPRVQIFPSPSGTVRLVGVTMVGHYFVAETTVTDRRYLLHQAEEVAAMEARVLEEELMSGPRLVVSQ